MDTAKNTASNTLPNTSVAPLAGLPPAAADAAARRRRRQALSRRQEWVRQWILLLPLATAAAGSAGVGLAQDPEYQQLLPVLFFVGALIVTVSMMHQRNILRENQQLAQRVQSAHERLDILHRLEINLNQSLDIAQVAHSVLEHAVESIDADAGALWLNPRFDIAHITPAGVAPSVLNGAAPHAAREVEELGIARGQNWNLSAAHGWKEPSVRQKLADWNTAFDAGACAIEYLPDVGACPGVTHQVRAADELDCPVLERTLGADNGALSAAIAWKGETVGVITLARWSGSFRQDELVLLGDIALVAGPSLENALLYQTAAARADMDGLTGLLNHRAMQERLAQEMARAQRALHAGAEPVFSIVMMDLTDFKMFNDTYGHAVGDDVLRTVCECLRQTFRASDIVARYGGDEFMAVLPETDASGAEVICGRLIETLRARPFQAPNSSGISVRLACGVAVFPHDGQSGAELFQAADERLYKAKAQGREIVPHIPTQNGEASLNPITSAGSEASLPDAAARDAIERDRVLQDTVPAAVTKQLWKSFGVLDTLIAAVDNRDHYTRRHSEQVMAYAVLLARELKLPPDMLEAVQICGLLHDVGKVAVPDAILRKPGLLNDEEMRLMQQHAPFGAMIVQNVPHLERVLEGVRSHHEALDGSGYPDGLRGESIPLMGRLLAVPACFAAMTTDRPYRKALPRELALQEIECGKGTQFDPAIVDAFLRVMEAQSKRTATAPAGRDAGRVSAPDAPAPGNSTIEQIEQAAR